MISEIRNEVNKLIDQNKHREVLRNSNFQTAGIYMLYIDVFDDDTIIPFYIGQTNNFQKRHKQHLTELMSLNRLNRECYEYALIKDLYNGKARACKIFSYMVNHNCTLKNWHMIILDEIPLLNERLHKEQEYIDSLYAPFLGFNQLNYVTNNIAYNSGDISKSSMINIAKDDTEKLLKFSKYGFSQYNWYRVCGTLSRFIPAGTVMDEILVRISTSKEEFEKLKIELAQKRAFLNFGAEEKAWQICRHTIQTFFASHKLTSKDMQKLVLKVWLFDLENDYQKLEKYFARTRLKSSNELYETLKQEHGTNIELIKLELQSIKNNYAVLEEKFRRLSLFLVQQLLPTGYISHPLKTITQDPRPFTSDCNDNECHINIEYTCLQVDYAHDFYPEICKVDYLIFRNGVTNEKTVYINNSLCDFFEQDDVYYYERGFSAGPYNAFLVGNVWTHIPVSMEYRTGINEYSFKGVQTEDFGSVLQEINCLIDDSTKIIYTTSGHKRTILRYIDAPELKNLLLSKKLRRLCK